MGVTHLQGLSITPIERGGTAFEITAGTISITGDITQTGDQTITGAVAISSTVQAAGLINTAGANIRSASAANSNCGLRAIAAASAGVGVVATTKVRSSSRIFLTPVAPTTNYANVQAFISTIASGASFTIKLQRTQTAGTVATASGRVGWLIVNK
jgi:hypothetical protein